MQDSPVYHIDDADLFMMLVDLFRQGHDEVEIQHPTEGAKVITRKEFEGMVAETKMSPAERLQAKNQQERARTQMQIRFRTALMSADVARVDLDNGKFGYDARGNDLNVVGLTFIKSADYPANMQLEPGEVGCFWDESGKRTPIRICG